MQSLLIILFAIVASAVGKPAHFAAPLAVAPVAPYASPLTAYTAAAYTAAPFVAAAAAPYLAAPYSAAFTAPFAAYNAPLDSAFASHRVDIHHNHNAFVAAPARLIAPATAPFAAYAAATHDPARLVAPVAAAFSAPSTAVSVAPARYVAPAVAAAPARLINPAVFGAPLRYASAPAAAPLLL